MSIGFQCNPGGWGGGVGGEIPVPGACHRAQPSTAQTGASVSFGSQANAMQTSVQRVPARCTPRISRHHPSLKSDLTADFVSGPATDLPGQVSQFPGLCKGDQNSRYLLRLL